MPLIYKFVHGRIRACNVHTLGMYIKKTAKFQAFEMEVDQIKILDEIVLFKL